MEKIKSAPKGAFDFSSGTAGNRTPVQKVFAKKSTYIARFFCLD